MEIEVNIYLIEQSTCGFDELAVFELTNSPLNVMYGVVSTMQAPTTALLVPQKALCQTSERM